MKEIFKRICNHFTWSKWENLCFYIVPTSGGDIMYNRLKKTNKNGLVKYKNIKLGYYDKYNT